MENSGLIQIRIPKALKTEIQERSKALNMNVTSYLIFLVQKDLKKI